MFQEQNYKRAFFSSKIGLFVGRKPNRLFYLLGSHPKKIDFDAGAKPACLVAIEVTYLFLGAEKFLHSSDLSEIPGLSS